MKLHKNTTLSIPRPCTQSWDEMKPVHGGSFCGHCEKNVVDYSLMSDTAILLHVKQYGLGCGRFREGQLDRVLQEQKNRKRSWWAHLVFSIIGFFISQKDASSQSLDTANTTTQYMPTTVPNEADMPQDQTSPNDISAGDLLSVSGTLTDQKGEPLINAKVEIREGGVSRGITLTDFDGNYNLSSLTLPASARIISITFTWVNLQQTVTDIRLSQSKTVVNHELNILPQRKMLYTIGGIKASDGRGPLINAKEPTRQSIPLSNYLR